jgi:hypothetical protein
MDVLCLGRVVCCRVEVSACGWSLVQRSPTECGVSECDVATSKMRKPRPTGGLSSHEKKWTKKVFVFGSNWNLNRSSSEGLFCVVADQNVFWFRCRFDRRGANRLEHTPGCGHRISQRLISSLSWDKFDREVKLKCISSSVLSFRSCVEVSYSCCMISSGYSPTPEFYMRTFRNIVPSP